MNMPELPKNYRWKLEKNALGEVIHVILQRKILGFWTIVQDEYNNYMFLGRDTHIPIANAMWDTEKKIKDIK